MIAAQESAQAENTLFWKIINLITSGGVVAILFGSYALYGDYRATKQQVQTLSGGVSAPAGNNGAGSQIAGTMLSEAVGSRKNLEFIRTDIEQMREAVQDIRKDVADMKQRLVIETERFERRD